MFNEHSDLPQKTRSSTKKKRFFFFLSQFSPVNTRGYRRDNSAISILIFNFFNLLGDSLQQCAIHGVSVYLWYTYCVSYACGCVSCICVSCIGYTSIHCVSVYQNFAIWIMDTFQAKKNKTRYFSKVSNTVETCKIYTLLHQLPSTIFVLFCFVFVCVCVFVFSSFLGPLASGLTFWIVI